MPAASRPTRLVRVAVALGSNLGDRTGHLQWAVAELSRVIDGARVSAPEVTAPFDVPDSQPDYVNAVLVGRTRLSARALLDTLLALEQLRGRTRPAFRAARTLDLDLILYGDDVIDEPGLSVPHPRFRERPFVLSPLATMVPRWRDPVTGHSMAVLWRRRQISES